MGNSEVGHMNIGAGRVIYQDLPRINLDFKNGEFERKPPVCEFLSRSARGRVHLLGLVSDGGVHSHINHFEGMVQLLSKRGFKEFFIHAFTDGRDTSPTSGINYIRQLEAALHKARVGKIASISGRYYAMDRDKRWERLQLAYDAMVFGKGPQAADAESCVLASYENGVTDEFILPTVLDPAGTIRTGDHVCFMNFRPDRARQLCFALENNNFQGFETEDLDLDLLLMTPYSRELSASVIYSKEFVPLVLSEHLSGHGIKQLKIAETEKYAHVTYFMNGGREDPFEGEERILVPSPKVQTYDLCPEMSAPEVTRQLLKAIASRKFGFLAVNYANPDMVGHTGNLEAAVKAVKVVDHCIDQLLKELRRVGGSAFITADHGNLDEMIDLRNGETLTCHSLNQVDFIYAPPTTELLSKSFVEGGKLADIAPTILQAMNLPIPNLMEGNSLFT
jgi:2,3-bisphosphoglycerate-independent phosphoglycerate mutase